MVAEITLQKLASGASNTANLSFAGCGFLGIYHIGVASCFREYAPHLVSEQISGASAGGLVAATLISGSSLGDCTTYTLSIASKARARAIGPLHPTFTVVKFLREGLDEFLPDNAHEICSGRLNISLTRVSDRKNVIINQFDSKEDLIQALVCSAFVPLYCGLIPPRYKGTFYVDGGLSTNIPIINEDTITVSPFAGESDICPTDSSSNDMHIYLANTSVQFTIGNLYRASHAFFPPHPEVLSEMCKQGFDDALRFLQANNLINCKRHLSIQSTIISSEPLDDLDGESEVSDLDVVEELEDGEYSENEMEHGENDCPYGCAECHHRQNVAVLDSLPPSVITALQAACDSVNKGILAPIYNMKAYRVICLMATPYALPFDILIMISKSILSWSDYLPDDMQWFVNDIKSIIKKVVDAIQTERHRFSARFTCQLAITETDFNQDQVVSQPSVLALGSKEELHYKPSRHHNLKVDLALDFKTHHHSAISYVDDMREQVLQDKEHNHIKIEEVKNDIADDTVAIDSPGIALGSNTLPSDPRYQAGDTFSNCLQMADEKLLAFSYADEENPNELQVVEIFKMDETRSSMRTPGNPKKALPASSSSASGVSQTQEDIESCFDRANNGSGTVHLPLLRQARKRDRTLTAGTLGSVMNHIQEELT